MLNKKIGIDLGTTNTLVYVAGRGVALSEPSVVALDLQTNAVLAVGREAHTMIGRNPDSIAVHRPLKSGVIADFKVAEAMLRYCIERAAGRPYLFKPIVVISIPGSATSTERRAVVDGAIRAGAKEAYLMKEAVLAAIGAGVPIHSAEGHMVADIGGGTTDIAVISLGGMVAGMSARVGGDQMDEAIQEYVKRKYGCLIGQRTAEEIKMAIGAALPQKEEESVEVRGRDLVSGLPQTMEISSNEVTEAIAGILREVVQTIKQVLGLTPPELVNDIMDKGILLTGGSAFVHGIDELIHRATGVAVHIADDPLQCVVKGTGRALENLDLYRRSILARR
ncbi:MAG: rod shape-determining protein [bacterium]|nr:rod shape-determining protein [bacterium]MDZ4295918.1 rod shape-determining protein [Patescibacteria group bacterium]